MARRKLDSIINSVDVESAAADEWAGRNQSTDGSMVDEKDPQDKEQPDPIFDETNLNSPRHMELLRQKIRLTTGAEMELRDARANLRILRGIQNSAPDLFTSLVSIVKPKGLTKPPGEVSPQAIDALKAAIVMRPDGSLLPGLAEVLDAAYKETREGVVLADPIVYPSKAFFDEVETLADDVFNRFASRFIQEKSKKRRKGEGDGSPPM